MVRSIIVREEDFGGDLGLEIWTDLLEGYAEANPNIPWETIRELDELQVEISNIKSPVYIK